MVLSTTANIYCDSTYSGVPTYSSCKMLNKYDKKNNRERCAASYTLQDKSGLNPLTLPSLEPCALCRGLKMEK